MNKNKNIKIIEKNIEKTWLLSKNKKIEIIKKNMKKT